MERAGITTVSLAQVWTMTESVGAPRVAAIEHPNGRLLGAPDDSDTQLAVLEAMLEIAATATEPGAVTHLPFRWHQPRGAAMKDGAHEPPPVARLLKKKPWLLPRFIAGELPR